MSVIIRKKQLKVYVAKENKVPFVERLESLEDRTIRHRIEERLDRVALGNLGDHKFIDKGVYELRLAFGSGYRIYYGSLESEIILLLYGGSKATQRKDIKKAIIYLKHYLFG